MADAVAAFDVLRARFPALLDPANVCTLWVICTWDHAKVDRFVDGFLRAKVLMEAAERATEA